jgi:hypothetical protein
MPPRSESEFDLGLGIERIFIDVLCDSAVFLPLRRGALIVFFFFRNVD